MTKAVLVIDPLSSSSYLVNRLIELGLEVIALRSLSIDSDYFSYCDLPFLRIIESKLDIDKDIEAIKSIDGVTIIHGFTGVEASLPYAEKLLAKLFTERTNDPSTSLYRFDKFTMNEVLKQKNLTSIHQEILPSDMPQCEKVLKTVSFFKKNKKEIVIKPSSGSAASIGVLSPKTIKDIEQYYNEAHSLFYSSDIVIQEKLKGDEYYVDMVSMDGYVEIISIGLCIKKEINGSFLYHTIDALDIISEKAIEITSYVESCLHSLGMTNGFSHCEVIDTGSEYKLIELNPRISGLHGWGNLIAHKKYGRDQVSVYAGLLNNDIPPINVNAVKQRIFLFKNNKGAYSEVDLSAIKGLKSYSTHELLNKSMSKKKHEESILSLVMLVLLEYNDQQVIEYDSLVLENMEKKGDCLI